MSRLDEIQARLEGVTPGPWKLWGMSVMADPVGNSDLDDAVDVASTHMTVDGKPRTFDATFIAHAREDVPDLVEFARRIEAVLDDHVSTNEQVFDDLDRAMKRLNGGAS